MSRPASWTASVGYDVVLSFALIVSQTCGECQAPMLDISELIAQRESLV